MHYKALRCLYIKCLSYELELIIHFTHSCIYYNSRNIAVVEGVNHNSLNALKPVLTILLLYVFKMHFLVILDFSLAKTIIC